MPRQVDHAARRHHVATVAAELMATRGVEAMTVRRVAEAAGYSTTVVSHYFADKDDLLRSTYRAAADRSRQRWEAALESAPPPGALRAGLESLLPLDDDRRRDWNLWCAFWGLATVDRELRTLQADRTRTARPRIQRVVEADQAGGRIDPSVDAEVTARRLLVFVTGVGTQAVFEPEYWTAQRQLAMLERELGSVLGSSTPTTTAGP